MRETALNHDTDLSTVREFAGGHDSKWFLAGRRLNAVRSAIQFAARGQRADGVAGLRYLGNARLD